MNKEKIIKNINLLVDLKKSNLSITKFEQVNNLPKNRIFKTINETIGVNPLNDRYNNIKKGMSIFIYLQFNDLNIKAAATKFNLNCTTYHVYNNFFTNVEFIYEYIKNNNLPLPTYDYGWEFIKAKKENNLKSLIDWSLYKEEPKKPEESEKQQINQKENKPSFFELEKVPDNKPQSPQHYDVVPSNQIKIQINGIHISIDENVEDEKLIKLTKFLRSL